MREIRVVQYRTSGKFIIEDQAGERFFLSTHDVPFWKWYGRGTPADTRTDCFDSEEQAMAFYIGQLLAEL